MEPTMNQPFKMVGNVVEVHCDIPGLGGHWGSLEVWGSTTTQEIRIVLRCGLTGTSYSFDAKTARALAERLNEAAEKRTL